MSAAILLAAAVLAQSTAALAPVPAGADRADVAQREVAKDQADAATTRINTRIDRDDPAALINLGAAYARSGRADKARECYRAAIASEVRYDVQLADGRWMDSRRAARMAIEVLDKGAALAVR